MSLGVFTASSCVRLEGTVVATTVLTGLFVCMGVFAIDFITTFIYGVIKLAIKILYGIYQAGCWFAGK